MLFSWANFRFDPIRTSGVAASQAKPVTYIRIVSPVQCTKPFARNYIECTEMVTKNGNRSSDAWWWCSNQGFKN